MWKKKKLKKFWNITPYIQTLNVPEILPLSPLWAEMAHADYSSRTLHCGPDEEVYVYEDVVIFIFQQIDYQGNFIISLHSWTRSLPSFRLL